MSNSNLEMSKANRVNKMSKLNNLTAEPTSLKRSSKHVTKFRLDEIDKIKDYLNSEINPFFTAGYHLYFFERKTQISPPPINTGISFDLRAQLT